MSLLAAICCWIRRRHEATDSRVMDAIRSGTNYSLGISRKTGLRVGRVTQALTRLQSSGQITADWEQHPDDRPPRLLYSVTQDKK